MTYQDAQERIPCAAVWSASFGNPGEGGYNEYWSLAGEVYVISNGPYYASAPFDWTVDNGEEEI
jgi:hypothetical protein